MTLTTMRDRVRQRSRTHSDFVADSIIDDRINEAVTQLAKDVNGLIKEAYLPLTAKFDLFTHHAFNITIVGGTNALVATDIPVTDADVVDQTGAQAATELQERIRAAGPTTLTVAWDTANYKFTIDAIDSTSITIAAPSGNNYANVTGLLFAKTGTETATSWVGNVPQDVMLEVDLPSDFLKVKIVEWDRNPLASSPIDLFISPQASGTPSFYYIINKKMRVNAVPTSQKLFHLFYSYIPATLAADGTEVDVDDEIEDAVIFYATALIYEDGGDVKMARHFRARYIEQKNKYKQQVGNQNPKYRTYLKERKGFIRRYYTVVP